MTPASPLARPDIILWDWDNTLADSWHTIHSCLVDTFVYMGREPWCFDTTKQRVHRSLEESFPPLFGDDWKKAGKYYRERFEAIHLEKLQPLPGARDTLETCRELGIVSAVVSNKLGGNLRKETAHLNWDGYFAAVVGASDAANDKPAADPALLALTRAGATREDNRIWFIGDSLSDLQCAYALKASAVLFGDGAHISQSDKRTYAPHLTVRDHTALQAALA